MNILQMKTSTFNVVKVKTFLGYYTDSYSMIKMLIFRAIICEKY